MNKDKQIEEMANVLGDTWVVDLEGNPHDLSEVLMQCDLENIAKQICEQGYRKASDVAREIFAEIEEIAIINPLGNWVTIRKDFFAELKKKYESEIWE